MAATRTGRRRPSAYDLAREAVAPTQRQAPDDGDQRWGVYTRISKDEETDPKKRARGVKNQEKDIRGKIADVGGIVVDVYCDNDISASNDARRPEFERLLADIRTGRINGIAIAAVDRLTRQVMDLEHILKLHEKHGIELLNVGGDVDITTEQGRFVARMGVGLARLEIERMSGRIRAANRHLREQGKLLGGGLRYGWTSRSCADAGCSASNCKKVHTPLVSHPEQAAVIREGSDRILAGESLRSLTLDLNRRGLFNVRGNPWDRKTLKVMLCRARNAGLVETKDKNGNMVVVAEATDWKAVVDEETWHGVKKILQDDERSVSQKTRKVKHLLSFIAECGGCGDRMIASRATGNYKLVDGTKKQNVRPIYKCRGEKDLQDRAAAEREGEEWVPRRHPMRNRDEIDLYVTEYVLTRIENSRPEELLRAHLDADQAHIEAQLQDIEARIEHFREALGAGTLDADDFAAATRKAKEQREALKLLREPVRQEQVLRDFLGDRPVREVWDSLDLDRQRAVINTLCKKIVINAVGKGNHRRPISETVIIVDV